MSKWIKTNEKMPSFKEIENGRWATSTVLVATEDKTVHIGYAIKTLERFAVDEYKAEHEVIRWYSNNGDRVENVDRWCPLPSD